MTLRLRDKAGGGSSLPWPVGECPDRVLIGIDKQLVHRLAVGHTDITGDDFGNIFAAAVAGTHQDRPLGLADVFANGTAWSVKTVKHNAPHQAKTVRLISGRNSPDYSVGISDPRADPEATGRAVLTIWNRRVDISLDRHCGELRLAVMLRNMTTLRFRLFESPAEIYPTGDYRWAFNARGNLEGFNKATKAHCFTWQPHGSQFTVIRPIPGSARTFSINRTVPLVEPQHVLRLVHYDSSWISLGR